MELPLLDEIAQCESAMAFRRMGGGVPLISKGLNNADAECALEAARSSEVWFMVPTLIRVQLTLLYAKFLRELFLRKPSLFSSAFYLSSTLFLDELNDLWFSLLAGTVSLRLLDGRFSDNFSVLFARRTGGKHDPLDADARERSLFAAEIAPHAS